MRSKWPLPLIIWSILLLFLTWYPKIEIPNLGFKAQDKAAHFMVFFILGLLSCRAFSKYEIKRMPDAVRVSLIFGASFGCIDEIVQIWIPGRTFDPLDGLANIIGVLFAVLLFRKFFFTLLLKYRLLW
jgi:VanZ family protein